LLDGGLVALQVGDLLLKLVVFRNLMFKMLVYLLLELADLRGDLLDCESGLRLFFVDESGDAIGERTKLGVLILDRLLEIFNQSLGQGVLLEGTGTSLLRFLESQAAICCGSSCSGR
jgi:hypothetical protein